MRYYMITLDKCKLDKKPTKEDYYSLLLIFNKHFQKFERTKIECFEYKNKGNKYKKWIHYHGIIKSDKFLIYTKFKATGYSIKLEYLKNISDIERATEYIIKYKKDEVP